MEAMMRQFKDLQIIPFEEITKATNTFHKENYLGGGGFGPVYKGELSRFKERGLVAFKKLDRIHGQGEIEFYKEIEMLSRYKDENIITLLGCCVEEKELILVYECAANGSLDKCLDSPHLTWTMRLKISVQAAKGLRYLHDPNKSHVRVIHRDVKSANILLDDKWNAKVADFGLSKISPENENNFTYNTGTAGYTDPQYHKTYMLTEKSDVYSFGVTLYEVLCGRLCYDIKGKNKLLVFVSKWMKSYEQNKLEEIVFRELSIEQMDQKSLKLFSDIAYKCLNESPEKRPTMAEVVSQLEVALKEQERFDLIRRTSLPEEYAEIVGVLVSHPAYSSLEQLKDLLFQGILIHEGKTWIQLNTNGKHYEMISMASCLNESDAPQFSKSKSRFTVGSYVPARKKTTFMTRIKPLILSPNTTYIMNLVYRKKKPSELYNGLEYEFQDETYYSFLSDDREDGWSTAELFQFTTDQRTTVDELEIRFNIEHFRVIEIEGIEFQPLDDESVKSPVEHVDNQMDIQASDTNWGGRLASMDNHERLPTRVALKSVGWEYLPETSFKDVGQDPFSEFRISCNIESKILSRDTKYAGYLVYKQKIYDIQPAPAQVVDVKLGKMSDIYLQIPQTPVLISGEVSEDTHRSHRPNIKGIPQERTDGCMEVQIWKFKTNRDTAYIPMDLKLSRYDPRALKGLKAKGIEFRPIDMN